MANWKRLTGVDNLAVDVNLDNVCYLQVYSDHTALCFVGGRSDEGKVLAINVKEKPDEIHAAKAPRTA